MLGFGTEPFSRSLHGSKPLTQKERMGLDLPSLRWYVISTFRSSDPRRAWATCAIVCLLVCSPCRKSHVQGFCMISGRENPVISQNPSLQKIIAQFWTWALAMMNFLSVNNQTPHKIISLGDHLKINELSILTNWFEILFRSLLTLKETHVSKRGDPFDLPLHLRSNWNQKYIICGFDSHLSMKCFLSCVYNDIKYIR